MSKKTILTSLILFLIICLERLIQFFNLLRFHSLGFTTEYVIGQLFVFLYTYLPVIVLIPALIYLVLNLKKEKFCAFIPLVVTFITLWFFSNFSFYNTYSSSTFFLNFSKYEEIVELVKQDKLEYIEDYFLDDYKNYGRVNCYIYKLPKNYDHLVRDNMDQSTIIVWQSEKKGLIQVEIPINGIQFTYIFVKKDNLFQADCYKYKTIEKRNSHWYYVVYQ